MKKILALLAIVILFVVGCSMFVVNQGPSKQEMIEVLKSDEAQGVIIEDLKQRDSNALTTFGIIKSYEVDYDSVEWNPMGGITFITYINGDKDLYVLSTILKEDRKLKRDGGSMSTKLDELIIGKVND